VQNAGASTVLLVEDEALERQGILAELGRQGYRVDVAANGHQALQRLAERGYDAVVLDLILPDAHGFDILKAVRTRPGGERVAVIIVTRLPRSDVRTAYPVQDILQKPVSSAVVAEALQRAGAMPGTHRPVLVVDDDPAARKLMEAHLKGLGFRATFAPDGRAALESARGDPPVAVILDLAMPVMDGFEFLERFRQTREGREAPVLVWTNSDLTAEERVRLEGSAQMIVYKARDGPNELVSRLETLLGRRAA
jgi:CheY-like chemotaxis protein